MRIAALAVAALAAGCAGEARPGRIALHEAGPLPVWRLHTEHLEEDRALAGRCLAGADASCAEVVQTRCRSFHGEDEQTGALARQCDWRAIAAWEDEMNALLTLLRGELSGRNLENLEASQRAWDRSMQADVGLLMDLYEGGSAAGQVGAYVLARTTEERVRYLSFLHDEATP